MLVVSITLNYAVFCFYAAAMRKKAKRKIDTWTTERNHKYGQGSKPARRPGKQKLVQTKSSEKFMAAISFFGCEQKILRQRGKKAKQTNSPHFPDIS